MQKMTAQVLAIKFVKSMVGGIVYNIKEENVFESNEPKIWTDAQSEYDILTVVSKSKDNDSGLVSCYIKGINVPFWVISLALFPKSGN